jgi:stage II sporulation protein D
VVLGLVLAACPALAVVTPARAAASAPSSRSTAAAGGTEGLSLTASVSPSPSPSASPGPTPILTPDPSGSPSPDPSASDAPSPTPSPTPAPTPPWSKTITTVGASIQFYGGGNGHGVGMSQWGARGRALAGQTAGDILAAYFGSSTVLPTSPTRAVRVLVLSGFKAAAASPLLIVPHGGPWTIDGLIATFPADASLTSWRAAVTVSGVTTTTWHLHVTDAGGATVLYDGTAAGSSAVIRPATPATTLQLDSKPSFYDLYRGSLTLQFHTGFVNVVNTVGIDDYLSAVVPAEMPASWPAEALKAQAIVSRSWTVRHLHPSTGEFDVYDDSRSQVYQGVRAENAGVNALIAAQPGALLYYGTSVVDAFYCSAAGGWTENNEDAFVPASGIISSAPLPYLRGRDDRAPGGAAYDAAAPGFTWQTASLTHAQLDAILDADARTNVGTVLRLDLTHRGVSGRLYRVVIYGSTATKTVSGDVFRAVFNAHRPSGTASMLSNLLSATPIP